MSESKATPGQTAKNTDQLLWRENWHDHYAPSIFKTEHGTIGINVGGTVHVMALSVWHKLASAPDLAATIEKQAEEIDELKSDHAGAADTITRQTGEIWGLGGKNNCQAATIQRLRGTIQGFIDAFDKACNEDDKHNKSGWGLSTFELLAITDLRATLAESESESAPKVTVNLPGDIIVTVHGGAATRFMEEYDIPSDTEPGSHIDIGVVAPAGVK